MGKYEGFHCAECDGVFTAADDVVVCPICGAPHHRDCYIKRGSCAEAELHGTGTNYTPRRDTNTDNSTPCQRCGHPVPESSEVCPNCFTPKGQKFHSDYQERRRPNQSGFYRVDENIIKYGGVNPEEEISGVKVKDLAEYVGPSSGSFIRKWFFSQRSGSAFSMNFSALLFGPMYFLYRKMFLLGILYLLFSWVSSIPSLLILFADLKNIAMGGEWELLNNVFGLISIVVNILASGYFNKLYLKRAEGDIKSGQTKKGGVSVLAVALLIMFSFILSSALTFFVIFNS